MKRVSCQSLKTFIADLFVASGLPAADAQTVAQLLVEQEMRGVRTHGLRRVHPNLEGLGSGQMKAAPQRRWLHDAGATAVLDGDHGVGMLGCMAAMEAAIGKARIHGIGLALVVHNNHFLSAAPYCLEAVRAGMIGLAMSNTYGSMGYPGTTARAIANSPLGFAIPTSADFPIVFDAALTTSGGKLAQYIREKVRIPMGLLGLDAQGHPSDDPQAVLQGGTPMPIGGYKGAGLAILVEVLTGVLGGAAFLKGLVAPERREGKHQAESQCCIAIDVGHFMPVAQFQSRMRDFIADLKDNPLAPGCEEITVPGERMHRCWREAVSQGVAVEDDVAAELRQWARRLQVPLPPAWA